MFIIWRRWGWLILPSFLLVWTLAEGPIAQIYKNASGLEYLYNADKGICWAIGFFVVAVIVFLFWFLLLRNETKPITDEQWQKRTDAVRKIAEDDAKSRAAKGLPPVEGDPFGVNAPRPGPKPSSTFFFIPFKFFPFIFVAIGILMLFLNIPVAMEEFSPNR